MNSRLVALFVVLALCVTTSAIAEAIDFSTYTYAELEEIRSALDAEMNSRPEGGAKTLAVGQYAVGSDIEPGEYLLGFVADEEDDTASEYYVYENRSMYEFDVGRLWLGDFPRTEGRVKGTSTATVKLYEGDYFIVYRSSISYKKIADVAPIQDDYTLPDGTLVPVGHYVVGNEIPAGGFNAYFGGEYSSRVRIYGADQDWDNEFTDPEVEAILTESNDSTTLHLDEGAHVVVQYNPIIMEKADNGMTVLQFD